MYRKFPEITEYSQRHECDLLERYEALDASPAQLDEIPVMIALAREYVPGVAIADSTVERIYRKNPESILPFRLQGRIVGGIALLYLNDDGLDRLLLDELDFSDPDPAVLAEIGESPAAIYIWAIAARGRAAAGIANVCAHMRDEPYARADFYSLPQTWPGTRILVQTGFTPISSFQRDLWVYRRLCNRKPAQPEVALGWVA
jgi:hypothetical protein